MKVIRMQSTDIDLRVIDEKKRDYELISPAVVKIFTDCGVYTIVAQTGTRTDGRSGGWFVDRLLPNIGDKSWRPVWFAHDCAYSHASYCDRNDMTPAISFETANELFYLMGTLSKKHGGAGLAKWSMRLARHGVGTFVGQKVYDTTDKTDRYNDGKIKITWGVE